MCGRVKKFFTSFPYRLSIPFYISSSGQSSGSAKKASAAKTSRLEAEVNELNFQLRSVQKQKEDLQLEFEKLQVLLPLLPSFGMHVLEFMRRIIPQIFLFY